MIGKHRGSFWKDLLRDQRDYCEWAASLEEPTCVMKLFSEWCKAALRGGHPPPASPTEEPDDPLSPPPKKARAAPLSEDGAAGCKICYDAAIDSAFVPCGHSVCCYACARKIDRAGAVCPICREEVHMAMRLFVV